MQRLGTTARCKSTEQHSTTRLLQENTHVDGCSDCILQGACSVGFLHTSSCCVLQRLVRVILILHVLWMLANVARASAFLREHDQCLELCNLRMPGKIAAQLKQGCLTCAVLKHHTTHGHMQLTAVYGTLVTWIPFRSCGPTCADNRSRASRFRPGPWPTSSRFPAAAACTCHSNALHWVLT